MKERLLYSGNWTFTIRKDFIMNPSITAGAKCVWIALKSFCAPDGATAFPSHELLAAGLGLSRNTVSKNIDELIIKGFLIRESTTVSRGCITHHTYSLCELAPRAQNLSTSRAQKMSTTSAKNEHVTCAKNEHARAQNLSTKIYHIEDLPNKDQPSEYPPASDESVDSCTARAPGDQFSLSSDLPKIETNHPKLIRLFCEAFKFKHGVAYGFDKGRDAKATQKLLTYNATPEEVVELAKRAWENDSFNCRRAQTIHGLADSWNQIRIELKSEHSPNRPQRTVPTGRVNAWNETKV